MPAPSPTTPPPSRSPPRGFTHGSTTFTYTITDGAGGSDTATVTLTIANVNPVAADDTASSTCVTPIDIDVLANDTDANGDTLTVTAVTGATHGTATIIGTGPGTQVRYVPDGAWSGDDTLTYTLSDGSTTTTGQLTVTTGSCAPTADPFSSTVGGGTTSIIDVLAHTSDPDSAGNLTVSTSQPPTAP